MPIPSSKIPHFPRREFAKRGALGWLPLSELKAPGAAPSRGRTLAEAHSTLLTLWNGCSRPPTTPVSPAAHGKRTTLDGEGEEENACASARSCVY